MQPTDIVRHRPHEAAKSALLWLQFYDGCDQTAIFCEVCIFPYDANTLPEEGYRCPSRAEQIIRAYFSLSFLSLLFEPLRSQASASCQPNFAPHVTRATLQR